MRVILPTYRGIDWIVKAYALLHAKYWGAPVTLLAEDDYSDGQFEFVRPPPSLITNGTVPAAHFSDVLIWYLRQIQDTHVIIMLADYLIYRPVDLEKLIQLEEYMLLHDNVLRGQVGDDANYCRGAQTDAYKDLVLWEGKFYEANLTPGMWNRQLLLSILKPSLTALQVEKTGQNEFFRRGGMRSVAPAPGCLLYINALRAQDMHNIVMTEEIYAQVGHLLKIEPKSFI